MGNEDGRSAALHILLVDDDAMVLEATAAILSDVGHTVVERSDGLAALDYLVAEGPVDLLITDITMPRLDGLSLAEAVRKRWPTLPVLLVSGRPQPSGTEAFIAKPFAFDTLVKAVSHLVPKSGPRPL